MINSIAIVTLYDELNIGNKLQNYALQEFLKKYGRVITTLKYTEHSPVLGWKGKLAVKLGFPTRVAKEKKRIIERRRRFEDFSKEYITTSEPFSYKYIDPSINEKYDFFVAGSDQVWHNFTKTKEDICYFLLSFAVDNKRVCFAPSLGFDFFPDEFKAIYSYELSKYKMLSCREISGCRLIEELTGKKTELLPDPTMLLSVEDWIKIEKKPRDEVPTRYLLSYMLGSNNIRAIRFMKDYCESTGAIIVDLLDAGDKWFLTRPDEFIYLLRRAECICTDSFHAAVFSIMFRKKLKIFERIDYEGKRMGSRITDLVAEFNLAEKESGIIESYDMIESILNKKKVTAENYVNHAFMASINSGGKND